MLIPRKALQELQQLLSTSDAEKIEFADDEHTLFFRVGHRTLSTRKLTGQFPNFEAVMPRENTKFAVVRSSELASAIERVAQFADERSGRHTHAPGEQRIENQRQFHRVRRERRHHRHALLERPHRGRLQLRLHPRLPRSSWATKAKSASSSRTRSPPARCAPKTPMRSTSTAMSSCRCASETRAKSCRAKCLDR